MKVEEKLQLLHLATQITKEEKHTLSIGEVIKTYKMLEGICILGFDFKNTEE